jgi:hypothetical protein
MLELSCGVFLVKIAKYCLFCSRCEKSSEKMEYQQSLLDTILDIDASIECLDEKQGKSMNELSVRLTKVCFKCDGKAALVHKEASDYLNKFGNFKEFSTKGNLVSLPSS